MKMNDLSMDDASTDILLLGDDELDQVSGGIFPIVIGVFGISFFAGAFFGTLTSQLIRHLR